MTMKSKHDVSLFQAGWHVSAMPKRSPNFDARPTDCTTNLLVIHAISLPLGQFSNPAEPTIGGSYIDDLFLNQLNLSAHPDFAQLNDVRVSAHFLIRRNGALVQFVSIHDRAWHAGVSSWQGRSRCNDFSIGVELEGSDFEPFESAQYETLATLTADLITHSSIQHIVGHQDIAPTRKTDPGPFFDWQRYQNCLIKTFPLALAHAVMRDGIAY